MRYILSAVIIIIVVLIGLNLVRSWDEFQSYWTWRKLERLPDHTIGNFSSDMVADLPDPARRYFEYSIQDGTPLQHMMFITMNGRLGLGPKERPDYMDMTATQVMSFPDGFIWTVKTGNGPMVVTGSDGFFKDRSWSRFWLMKTVPVGRAGGRSKRREDHQRAAFGRLAAEAVFWSPAALLPSETVSWEALDPETARATIRYDGLVQTVDVTVNEIGQPVKVIIPRWSDSNPANTYKLQPFGGYLSAFKNFEGYQLATHVEGGNFIGTDDYFPFYIADVTEIEFTDSLYSKDK